jgi:hypothetical protein
VKPARNGLKQTEKDLESWPGKVTGNILRKDWQEVEPGLKKTKQDTKCCAEGGHRKMPTKITPLGTGMTLANATPQFLTNPSQQQ